MNPYYHPEQLGLEIISFDEPDLAYEYNTLCFWASADGKIYSASDSGCSCPTPFEDKHDRPTCKEVLNTLNRVTSVKQAERIFDEWKNHYGRLLLTGDMRRNLVKWVKARLKK